MYRIVISPHAKRQLKRIPFRYRVAIKEAIDEMKDDPFLGKALTRELTKKYSYRIGIYRIIYKIDKKEKIVNIISAGHRAAIYH